MAPFILPRDWLAVHPSYAALDEYLRWAQSRQGGQFHIHPKSGEIVHRKDSESDVVLPTTVYRNILDHLDHVFTKDGTGPSVLDRILEMLPDSALKNLRSVTKSIGTAATKTICKTIRLPTDSFTNTNVHSGRTLINFITAFTKSARRVSGRMHPVHDPPAVPNFKLPSWSMNPEYVKELYFYPDPVCEERIIKLFVGFNQQLEANDIFNPSIATRATLQDGKQLLEHPRDTTFQEYWYTILFFIEHCTNLEVFTWNSTVWQPVELLQVLAFNCPKLAKLDLNFTEVLLEPGGVSRDFKIPQLKHKLASEVQQIAYTLPLDMEIRLRVAVRRDEFILPILLHLGAFTRKVDTLVIDRSLSDDGYSAVDQGWDTESPLMVNGNPVTLASQALFEVRSLSMISIGNKSRYVMPLLDTTELRELVVDCCLNVEFILEPVARNAKFLTSVAIQFEESHAQYIEKPVRYHHLKVQDCRYALDFVRAGNFTLTDLLLHADFADSKRTPKSYSLLVPDLWFAIQAHMATLVRLSVLNLQDDFRVTDIEELGRCAPHLQELRIQARLGYPEYGMPSPRTEGLAWSLNRALLAFRTHKTLRVLAILRSSSTDINPDEDPEHHKFVLNSNLEAVINAINHEVPIKLFTFMEEPQNQPPTSHFFYNKTPFEPDVTWGVYPSPPPPVRKDAQYFKSFEFHETIKGFKGQVFHEQGNRMLAKHETLVKELQLWHPETKRGGATFGPERLKLPTDTVRMIQQPTPPGTYVGDFGDPRWQQNDAVILGERLVRGLPSNPSSVFRTSYQLAASRDSRAADWSVAKNPNAKKYYVSKSYGRSSWNNPNRVKVSREEKMLRISEEDRNELFGKDLPSYDPVILSESEFDAMTGQDLYEWEDLYSVLDQASIDKLTILETPSTDENREAQYEVLSDYAPQEQSWDIDNPYNFVLAKYALCARQRVFILKAAILKQLVTPEPIPEAKFWAKEQNDQLVWLHLNGYVNNIRYPLLTLAYALQPMSAIKQTPATAWDNVEADEAYSQMRMFFDDVHRTHILHARATGKLLPGPIPEEAFNEISNYDLYNWATVRHLMQPVSATDLKALTDTKRPPYVGLLAGTYRGEILRLAAARGLVEFQPPSENEIQAMTDDSLYHWAVSRELLPALPLKDKVASGILSIDKEKAARAASKRDDIIAEGMAARFIVASPITPTPRSRHSHPSFRARAGARPPAPTVEDVDEYEPSLEFGEARQARRVAFKDSRRPIRSPIINTASAFVTAGDDEKGDEEAMMLDIQKELKGLSKEDLVLKVMGLCTGTPLMEEMGMQGLLEGLSQYGKEELLEILKNGSESEGEEEEDEEDGDY